MPRSVISASAIPAGTGVTVLARVRGADGQLVTRQSLTSITYSVADLTDGTVLGTGTLTVSAAVFNDLQQGDARWTQDGPTSLGPDGEHGFNFAATLPAALFAATTVAADGVLSGPERGHRFQADFVFTPVTGQPWRLPVRWQGETTYA